MSNPATSAPAHTYVLRELAVPVSGSEPDLAQEIAAFLRLKKARVSEVKVVRKSLDSRRRNQPLWRFTVEFAFDGPLRHPRVVRKGIPKVKPPAVSGTPKGKPARYRPAGNRIAVIGSGPAGMAAALGLSRKGYAVTVFEQGSDVGRRFQDIRRFLKGAAFNARSNILFGEGGAGTFSDGKLTCRTRTPYTDAFLADLVAAGAEPGIAYESHPHIGTDQLQFIIKAFRERCVGLGAAFRFNTLVEDLLVENGRVTGVVIEGAPAAAAADANRKTEAFDAVVLAMGHSSRALYARLVEKGVALEPKPFAVGVRVEHPQDMVNRRQLGEKVDPSMTGAAEYFLTWNGATEGSSEPAPASGGPRSGYSFCMCPGGVIVPCADASDGLFTNGMSYSNRAGAFANSAVVVPVTPVELSALGFAGPLAGIDFIRSLEVKAFAMGGGDFTFPAQSIAAFLEGRLDPEPLPKSSFSKPLRPADFNTLFPPSLALALRESFRNFDRKMPGFIEKGFIIGPESRTSSPLRLLRHPESLESASTPGLFPLGEGAGYSGGIVSSGADGLRLADGWEEWAPVSAAGLVVGADKAS